MGEGRRLKKLNYVSVLTPTIDGFKTGMADLGYVEGKNATYIYNGVVEPQAIDGEVKNLLAQDVDMFFTVGNLPTLAAKRAVAGTDVPMVFGTIMKPVEEGVVESLRHPGAI